jgi:hypothetical protein
MKLVIMSISLLLVLSPVTATQVVTNPYRETESNVAVSSAILSPGIEVYVTDYDWQPNGSMGRNILLPSGGLQFAWTYRFGGVNTNRRVYYNYYYPPGYWLGATAVFTQPSIASGLDHMADGRALVAGTISSVGMVPAIAIDAVEGGGTFTIIEMPVLNPLDPILWPQPCVLDNGHVCISGTSEDGLYIIKSTDEGTTWSDWMLVDSTGGHESWAAFSEKTALIYEAGIHFANVFYWETTDNGVTWFVDTVFIPSSQDSVVGYVWNSAIYDNNGYLHVVFSCIDTTQAGQGGPGFSGCRSQIRHWNQETGQFSIVASGWWTLNPGPGSPHPTVSESQITVDRATGTLYCTWCQADSGDVAANGYTNLEIYGAYSTNNGTTWSAPVNITNSQSPGATAGYCENDCWQSIAEITHGDTVFIFYMNDKDAGCSVYGQGVPTDNPMLFYLYSFSIGVEGQKPILPSSLMLHIAPNPAARKVNISYTLPQPGKVTIDLYSIDGRLVRTICEGHKNAGIYRENIDCTGIANGIYFVILETATNKESHSVVVIH